ncbi:DNA double-strand break repair nuclease NurA [Pyrofollis japonicus]|nr:DNA double-strand break repair nuclease NurA [Pyrofollis japonicus]
MGAGAVLKHVGDWFIDIFTSEAEKLIDILKERRESRILIRAPNYWWLHGLPARSPSTVTAAVDGGGGIQPLAFGWSVYIARAYGYVEGGEPERGLELRIFPVRDTRVLDALRSWLEHRVATTLAARLGASDTILMDGSLWVTVSAAFASLARLASGNVESIAGVYTALFSAYLLAEIVKFVETAQSRRIVVAYVSKDHGFRAYKEKVLLDFVAEKTPVLGDLVNRALEWYPLALRDQLIAARRLVPAEYRPVFDAALDPSYRDALFLADVVGGNAVGYTWILNMPPSRRVAKILQKGGIRTLVERAIAKAETLLGDEPEVEELRSIGYRLMSELDRLPRIKMLYVKLSPEDYPLLVEVPGSPGDYYSPGRLLEEPGNDAEHVVALLKSQYAGPSYYNIPLIAAHINATFTGSQLDQYMALLEQLANARGVSIRFARRRAVWGILSRGRHKVK